MKLAKRGRQVFDLLKKQGDPEDGRETLLRVLSSIMTADADTKDEAIQDAASFSADLVQDIIEGWDEAQQIKNDFKLKIVPGGRQ
jgi:hypothetical protein